MKVTRHPAMVPIFDNNRNYSNPPIWQMVQTGNRYVLEPNVKVARFYFYAIPMNAIVFSAVGYFNHHLWIAMLGIAVNTPLIILFYCLMAMENKKGPWLAYDKDKANLEVFRASAHIPCKSLVKWEVVYGRGGGESLSELNLWAKEAERNEFVRYPLVGMIGDGVLPLAKKLAEITGTPYGVVTVDNREEAHVVGSNL